MSYDIVEFTIEAAYALLFTRESILIHTFYAAVMICAVFNGLYVFVQSLFMLVGSLLIHSIINAAHSPLLFNVE